MERPERPVEPYSWNIEHFDNELLNEWKDYIYELEEYVDELESRRIE